MGYNLPIVDEKRAVTIRMPRERVNCALTPLAQLTHQTPEEISTSSDAQTQRRRANYCRAARRCSADLKPGAKIFIPAWAKKADGTWEAAIALVGRDGITPPM